MLVISTVNTAGLTTLYAVVEKVDNDGLILSPRIIWDHSILEFVNISALSPTADAYIPLVEDTLIPGYYTVSVDEINQDAENILVKIIYWNSPADPYTLGESISLPGEVTPAVTLQFEVNEDRA